jgi:threonine dehydrogenase-like Zn-dependent dehydrogenase
VPRRLAITGPYQLDILEYTDPPLQANQALVKTELASGKHGTTLAMLDNRTFAGQRFDQETRLFLPDEQSSAPPPSRDYPWNLGTTGVGTIVAVGENVTRWRIGDKVFGLMDVRETNVCDEKRIWPLGTIDPHDALCIEPAYVSFHCIRESNVRYGDTVAVIGLGALGLLAVRMAHEAGAETIMAIDPLAARRELALKLGADHALDPLNSDAALEAHRLTGNAGVDVAVELSGVYTGLQMAIRCTRVGGTVCSAGFYQGEANSLWLGREWHHNRLTMIVPHGCGWGHHPRDYPRWDGQRAYDTIASLMSKGQLSGMGLVNVTVPFEDGTGILHMIHKQPEKVVKYAVQF